MEVGWAGNVIEILVAPETGKNTNNLTIVPTASECVKLRISRRMRSSAIARLLSSTAERRLLRLVYLVACVVSHPSSMEDTGFVVHFIGRHLPIDPIDRANHLQCREARAAGLGILLGAMRRVP